MAKEDHMTVLVFSAGAHGIGDKQGQEDNKVHSSA